MTLVIDASITMAWCFEDESTEHSEAVLELVAGAGALVPSLWRLEVTNVLAVAERKRRLTEAQSSRFVSLLAQLPIDTVVDVPPMPELMELVRRHGLSSYDATYLWLSATRGLPLATLDERLADASHEAGVEVVGSREN
ncbi:MAG: type II toxin-antitoxin system VapC family toxin [Actinomycetota bacterium]|nr:type II toxin-antitoxin system VapC family toxin [Actinomycetota bacterium]